MYNLYFSDPRQKQIIRTINQVTVRYYYFSESIMVFTGPNEVCNFCLLKGKVNLLREQAQTELRQFDLVFLPPNEQVQLIPRNQDPLTNKICIVTTPLLGEKGKKATPKMEIQRFSLEKFIPRGELGDTQKMATYREVWTAFKNGYFMSGFTNIPQQSLTQGVVTSVNIEKEKNDIKVFSHVHPGYPEIYIYCIDDPDGTVAVTQFLINKKGQSVSKDLTDGEGIFFDGSLGHINFTKPTYKQLEYCLYMWIIPTYGKAEDVVPITLRF
jgi:hypothetical protein